MKKSGKSRVMFLFDLLVIFLSFNIYFIHHIGWDHISFKAIATLVFIIFAWIMISINSEIYKISAASNIFRNLASLFSGYCVLSVSAIVVVAVFGNFKPNGNLLLYPLLFSFVISANSRFIYLITIKHFIGNGYNKKSVLVIGGDRVAERVIYKIMASPFLGYKLYGVLADKYHKSLPEGIYLGRLERFSQVVRTQLIDEVIIALPLRREKELIDIVGKCEFEGIRFRIVPDFYRLVRNRMTVEALDDIPLIAVHTEPLNIYGNRFQKRLLDIVMASAAMAILSPLFLVMAIIIKYTDKGPVFYSQKRVGANNKEFLIYKFRSMYVQPETDSNTMWTSSEDIRVTKIGQFLRKTNIDELPQLWNVLKGDMSLVGPRPEREFFIEKFKQEIPDYRVRHLVKSGITGWAQINGLRGDTSISQRVEYDIHYIQYWSLWLDLKILLLTLFSKKSYKNAY